MESAFPDSRTARLGVAVLAALFAYLLGTGPGELAGAAGLYLFFAGGVLASAWFGGIKPGLLTAVILSCAGIWLAPGLAAVLFPFFAVAICAALRSLWLEQRRLEQN